MNRRQILKSGFFVTGGLLLTKLFSFKELNSDNNEEVKTSIALKLLIGELETYIFSDGIISLPSVQPIFATEIEKSLLNKELHKLHMPLNKLEGGINIMLIRKKDKIILLDTGSGHHFGLSAGKLISSLKSIQLNPEDVTDIIITHAHIDHIGGILDADENFVFPNAKYHIAKKEHDFWLSENPDFSNSKGDKSSANFNVSFAKNTLLKINSRLYLFDYKQELFSCLTPELAEGHTPGHTIFTINSNGKSLKHIVDTFHTPLLISKPNWGTQWDTDFDKAVQTRRKIMKEGAENGTLFMSCHLPWPGLGYIDKTEIGYSWKIYPYSEPTKITI